MKAFSYILVFLTGVLLTYIFINFEAIYGPQSAQVLHSRAELHISYSDFVSLLLTFVTVVLAAIAILIGVVAAYTFREIKDDARKAAKKEIDEELADLPEKIQDAVNLVVFKNKRTTSVEELEEGFDPTDTSER